MLVFKNNIHDPGSSGFRPWGETDPHLSRPRFDPGHFLEQGLREEGDTLSFLERQPREFWKEDALKFYPRAHKVGGLPTFRKLLTILQQGWAEPATWYHMNTYHFCFLYDILARFCFNYNHDNRVERLQTLPELQGREVPFDRFVEEFFFNTVFLLSEDEYNALSREEKESRGFTCPCQFAVIHGLAPTREELELRASKDYPYSIYV